jgi:DNA uptake protein ComE-like DNA-binding protein
MANAMVDSSFSDDPGFSNEYYSNKKYYSKKKETDFKMEPFDPNGLPVEIWIAMGLSEKQAMVIKNFELKGGKFKTKEDVKKQFVISEEFYAKIEPYIIFNEIDQHHEADNKPLSVDINLASQQELMQLPGIKDYLAEGIIKYRDRLGGFITKDQLKEVKYLSERIYSNIENQCYVSGNSVKKVNINLAEWKEFARHPYMGGDLATKIIDYRKKHGIFKTPEDFKKSGLVDEALYIKLVPYLSFTY